MPKGYWSTWGTTFIFFGAFYAVLVPLPLYLEQIGLPDWQIGMILGAFGVASLLSRPFAGVLADTYGMRPILLFGAAAVALGAVGMSLTTHPVLLLGLRAFQTTGYVAFTTSATALIASLIPAERRASSLALFGVAANTAMTIIPAIMNLLLTIISLRHAFWVAGALAAFCGLLVWRMLPNPSFGDATDIQRTKARNSGYFDSAQCDRGVSCSDSLSSNDSQSRYDGLNHRLSRHTERSRSAPDLRAISLTSTTLALPGEIGKLMGMAVVLGVGFGAFLQFAPLLAARRPVGPVGLAYTLYGLGIIGTRVVTGRLLDQPHRLRLIAGGFVLMAIGSIGLAGASSQGIFLGAAVLVAMASGILHPGLIALHVEQLSAHQRGRAAGLFYLGFDLGIGLGALCASPVLQQIGLTGFYLVAAIMQCLGLGLLTSLKASSCPNNT